MVTKTKVLINTDGGARGNPGPAAIGVVISIGQRVKRYSEKIEDTTNNIAEYKAIIFALKKVKQLIGKKDSKEAELELYTDSELLYKQINGKYKVKDEKLIPLFIEVWNRKQDFYKVTLLHKRREDNKEADKLVNQALDTLNL